jgi:hypothetical protein
MTRGLALLLCVGALVAAACRTGVPVIDTGPKPPTSDGTIAGHVSTGSGATGVPSRIVRAINVASGQRFETTTNNAGTYTLKVPPGKYRIEVELRPGERVVKQPGQTEVHKSDLDPNRDFELTAGGQ